MRWPTARTRRPPESDIPPRASVPGRRRLVIAAAGLAGVLVVALISAAFAGVFSGTLRAAAASPPAGQPARPARTAPATPARAGGPAPVARTSCASVAHIGDSTSVGMVSAQWLPDAAQRLGAQYRDVGVRHVLISASGGRSIVEELPGQVNGYRVASAWYQQGYRGCWVFALGTNDAANVAAGSAVGLTARIEEMMSAAHGEPVLWVNTQTELSSGPGPRPSCGSGTRRSPRPARRTRTCESSTGRPWSSLGGTWRTGSTTPRPVTPSARMPLLARSPPRSRQAATAAGAWWATGDHPGPWL